MAFFVNPRIELMVMCIWSLLAAFTLAAVTQLALGDLAFKKTQYDQLGAVASESAICSRIGIDLLKAGGNAADAHVGTAFCVGVIGMYHSGIGGGGFMLIRGPNGSYEAINFRDTAPAAAFESMYTGNVLGSIVGGLSVGVPGEVRGFEYLHRNYGVLPWRTVLQPAINVARNGFPVGEDLVYFMEAMSKTDDFLTRDPSWAVDFAPNGTRLGLGHIMTRRRYADTLETIAQEGANAFYNGTMADAMVKAVRESNGTMTTDDVRGYEIVSRSPVNITYRGYRVFGCGAPASGAVVLSALKMVEGFDDFGEDTALNLSTHRLDEAMRFGYGQRTSLGDPDYTDNIDVYESQMMNATTAALHRAKASDLHTLNVSDYDPYGFENTPSHGTSHIVTADTSGLAITLTTTINLIFGARIVVPETGVILNDGMNDFSIPHARNEFGYYPSPSNYIRPHKRPLSSITPTIVEFANHTLHLITGAAGGSRIITSTLQILWHILDHNISTADALAMPRFHDQLMPNEVHFEEGYDMGTIAFMETRGHNTSSLREHSSAVQAIRVLWDESFEVASEPRQKDSGGFVV